MVCLPTFGCFMVNVAKYTIRGYYRYLSFHRKQSLSWLLLDSNPQMLGCPVGLFFFNDGGNQTHPISWNNGVRSHQLPKIWSETSIGSSIMVLHKSSNKNLRPSAWHEHFLDCGFGECSTGVRRDPLPCAHKKGTGWWQWRVTVGELSQFYIYPRSSMGWEYLSTFPLECSHVST